MNHTLVKISRFFQKEKIHGFSEKTGFYTNTQYSHISQEMQKILKHVWGVILSGIQKNFQIFFSHIFWILKIDLKIKWNPNICRRKILTKFLKSPYQKTQVYKILYLFDMYSVYKLLVKWVSAKLKFWISHSLLCRESFRISMCLLNHI